MIFVTVCVQKHNVLSFYLISLRFAFLACRFLTQCDNGSPDDCRVLILDIFVMFRDVCSFKNFYSYYPFYTFDVQHIVGQLTPERHESAPKLTARRCINFVLVNIIAETFRQCVTSCG